MLKVKLLSLCHQRRNRVAAATGRQTRSKSLESDSESVAETQEAAWGEDTQ